MTRRAAAFALVVVAHGCASGARSPRDAHDADDVESCEPALPQLTDDQVAAIAERVRTARFPVSFASTCTAFGFDPVRLSGRTHGVPGKAGRDWMAFELNANYDIAIRLKHEQDWPSILEAFVQGKSADQSAQFTLGETGCSLVLELRNDHPLLAEYQRRAHLRCGDEQATADLGMDSGGHAAVNVYRISASVYALHCFSGVTIVDAARRTLSNLSNDESREQPTSGSVHFMGAFDFAPAWRFVPAEERAESKLTIIKGG